MKKVTVYVVVKDGMVVDVRGPGAVDVVVVDGDGSAVGEGVAAWRYRGAGVKVAWTEPLPSLPRPVYREAA